jgi:2-amino-4-hydroxy-6-hydroxymethyldihydropteridine diphosphokinase
LIGYIGLGSNLGDRRVWLRTGIVGLRAAGLRVLAVSSVWESEPVGTTAPPWFLNMAVAVSTGLPPRDLLELLLEVERRAGRTRCAPNSPRTLDMDLLLLGGLRWMDERLELPHPRMWERPFVLEPLSQIAPDTRNPRSGRTVAEECERIRGRSVCREVGALRLADIIRASTPTRSRRSASRHEVQIDRR